MGESDLRSADDDDGHSNAVYCIAVQQLHVGDVAKRGLQFINTERKRKFGEDDDDGTVPLPAKHDTRLFCWTAHSAFQHLSIMCRVSRSWHLGDTATEHT